MSVGYSSIFVLDYNTYSAAPILGFLPSCGIYQHLFLYDKSYTLGLLVWPSFGLYTTNWHKYKGPTLRFLRVNFTKQMIILKKAEHFLAHKS